MLKLNKSNAEIYFPQGTGDDRTLARTTHLGIGAHQDDLEIFAIHGILAGLDDSKKAFTGVTVTNGRGAPRSGQYAGMSDDDLWKIRNSEQKRAADIGHYSAQILLNYASSEVKGADRNAAIADLQKIIRVTQPEVIYTHNLADKHETHVAVVLSVIDALRGLSPALKDVRLYGCEVWGDLDWLPDEIKTTLDVSGHPELQKQILDVFESQIVGGKRYDLAAIGRRVANATYFQSHQTDQVSRMVYAMDLTSLVENPEMSVDNFISEKLARFTNSVLGRITALK